MKKPAKKAKKKKSTKKKNTAPQKNAQAQTAPKDDEKGSQPVVKSGGEAPARAVQKQAQKPAKQLPQKKPANAKASGSRNVSNAFGKAGLFLREAKTELKKVKWPTRKELLASTAVVIVLTLFVALYLGLVDFGLIKIIKLLVN